jgi:hypothetical protein
LDIFRKAEDLEVGLSVTSANDEIRRIFESNAPAIEERLEAIESLHQNGIETYVMIAPILPEAENLVRILAGKVDYVIIDRMNYHHADRIYDKYGWNEKNTDVYFHSIGNRIAEECKEKGIECRSVY